MIEKIKPIKSIIGADEPYNTVYYRDVPDGFRFEDLTQDIELENTNAIWTKLINFANRYYSSFEINANTYADFLDGLQISYDAFKLGFENTLKNMDKLIFEKGQTITRTKSGTGTENGTNEKYRNYSENSRTEDNGKSDNINLAFDSQNLDPSNQNKTENLTIGSGSGNESQTDTINRNRTDSETETTTVNRFTGEDGINYFESVIKLYPNVLMDFVNAFKSNFTLREVLVW